MIYQQDAIIVNLNINMKLTMLDYIKETPKVALKNIDNYSALVKPLLDVINHNKIKRLWLIASGSSYNSCYCARAFMLKYLKCEIKIVTPFTFMNYEHNILNEDVAIVISQSGYSTNAIEALKKLKELKRKTICLTGNINSDAKLYSDYIINYGVGEELVGYVTKGVTTLCLFLILLTIEISEKKELIEEVKKAIYLNEEMLDVSSKFIETHFKSFTSMNQCYLCGSGSNMGTIYEGALKIGETLHIPSNAYEVEEYIHGPNFQLTPAYTVIFFDDHSVASERIRLIYEATRKISDRVFIISNNQKLNFDENALKLSGKVMSELTPLVYLSFIQNLSFTISSNLNTIKQHCLMKEFHKVVYSKTDNFENYDDDE